MTAEFLAAAISAVTVLGEATSGSLSELGPLQSVEIKLFDVKAIAWRDDPAGSPGYQLILELARARERAPE